MNQGLITIRNAVPKENLIAFKHPINWNINKEEHWAVLGPNGAGKTLLIEILLGKYALKLGEIKYQNDKGNETNLHDHIKFVAFHDIYSFTDSKKTYYQQRWNTGIEEEMNLVKDIINEKYDNIWVQTLTHAFGINELLNKKITHLSSGELRKFLIVRSALDNPRFLILDNPFIGLDFASRELLREVLVRLHRIRGLQIIILVSDVSDIDPFITHVLPIKDKAILPNVTYEEFIERKEEYTKIFSSKVKQEIPSFLLKKHEDSNYKNVLVFKEVNIKYGKEIILKNVTWKVKKGEKWGLLGKNGSGKSTLLSLIVADNPQAYANNITLFDKKRGTGESIWDIKKRIGYISPEMHLYYFKDIDCLKVVSSGFFDTIGLYKKCTKEQEKIAIEWMKVFGIENLQDRPFLKISTGEQRLVLLARTFVKNPQLLILDEPLHGLDMGNKKNIKKMIENFCTPDKTLIFVSHYRDEVPKIVTQQLVLIKS